jgi:zinc transport system ATP-binding protein
MTKSGKWYMQAIVEFQHVSKSYGEQIVIDDVAFRIEPASITTMIGPNGAGKTTIARLILGIDSPTSGKILRKGNKTAYVPQKISLNTSLPMDVKSLVKYLSGSNADDILKVIEFAKLDSLADKQISQLSGGQLQRVFLGAGLISKPDLIVLDEPTQGLDIQGQQEFYEIIAGIRDTTGAAIFMISHDLHAVMKSSDKVLCLNHHICCEGRPGAGHKDAPQVGIYTHHHDHNH